jgi:hypothetical protein
MLEAINKEMVHSKFVIEQADNYIYIVYNDWAYDCTGIKRRDFNVTLNGYHKLS